MRIVSISFNLVLNCCITAIFLLGFGLMSVNGQIPSASPSSSNQPTPAVSPSPITISLERRFLKNILKDQKMIWTSPFHMSRRNSHWLLGLGGISAGLIATDRYTTSWVDRFGSLPKVSHFASQGGAVYTVAGTAAGFYLVGRLTGNQRTRETGLLAAEALINSEIVTHALKFATQRSRPDELGSRGRFFSGGNSFPSGHATSIWSLATVIAFEYQKHQIIKYGAYGLATVISLSRYSGRNHYLSDLLIGSAIGYGIGRFTYKAHHDKTMDTGTDLTDNHRLPGYVPQIIPNFDYHSHNYGLGLIWHL